MRIVGGALGGRRLRPPPGTEVRPTSDRTREAMASALEARGALVGARVLDLFAGTGALGFEALSRGADFCTFVDSSAKVIMTLESNAADLELTEKVRVLRVDLKTAPRQAGSRVLDAAHGDPFTLVFADPPYAEIELVGPLLELLVQNGAIASHAIVVVEHAARRPP